MTIDESGLVHDDDATSEIDRGRFGVPSSEPPSPELDSDEADQFYELVDSPEADGSYEPFDGADAADLGDNGSSKIDDEGPIAGIDAADSVVGDAFGAEVGVANPGRWVASSEVEAEPDVTVSAMVVETGKRAARRLWGLRSGSWVIAFALLAIWGFVVLLARAPTSNPLELFNGEYRKVEVPKVVGLTQPKAIRALDESNLKATIKFTHSNQQVPRGAVIGQSPKAGVRAERDSAVGVLVNLGPARLIMPSVVNSTLASAKKALEDVGVTVTVETTYNEDYPKGQVLRQVPTAGELVRGGGPVKLVVSQGAVQRVVPDVRKYPIEGAAFLLGRSGFQLGTVTYARDPLVVRGGVVSTKPAQDSLQDKGTKIDVVISEGPEPVKVPQLIGLSEAQAIEAVKAVGLLPSVSSAPTGTTDPNVGKIDYQTPDPGTMLDPGTVVNFEVLRGVITDSAQAGSTTIPLPSTEGGT